MLVLKKDALVKLLGDELYGIELENEMLQDLENRANERREVQAKAQTRLKKLLAYKDGKDDWDPYAYIKLTELSKTFLVSVRR